MLAETGDFSGTPDEAGRVKTDNLVEGMKRIGYDVINVGEKDLAGGIEPFQRLVERSGLTFVNANFIHRDTGEPLFAPYLIKEYRTASRSVTIGFLGLNAANSAFAREAPGGRVVIMRDPVEAARLLLPALRRRVDLVVLLGNLGLRELTQIAAAVPDRIDLALLSQGARLSPEGKLETIGGIPALYSGDQGKRLGEARLTLAGKGDPARIDSGHVFLTRDYPAEPGLQALIDATIARYNDVNRSLAEKAASTGAARPAAASGTAAARAPGAAPPAPGAKPYLTFTACETCHSEAHEIYLQSAHARAYDTLIKANQDFNPECVRCHVTGFDQPMGFVNARATPELANVQCEACHGNASEHVADPQRPFGQVPPRSCFACHTKENSPDFVFFKYWASIKH